MFIKDGLPNVFYLLSACCGLVVVDPTDDTIRLVHYTAQEYFDTIRSNRYPSGHTAIARTCLTYLSFQDFGTGPCFNLVVKRTDYAMLKARMNKYALLHYASCHWGDHIRLGLGRGEPITDSITQFLERESNFSSSWQLKYCFEHPDGDTYGFWGFSSQSVSGLHVGAIFGLVMIASNFYHEGTCVDARDTDGMTPLHWAAFKGHVTMAKQLLEWGARIDAKDKSGQTSLYWAAMAGHAKVVELLLQCGADTKPRTHLSGKTAFAIATRKGHEAIVRVMITQRQDELGMVDEIRKALVDATNEGNEAVVRILLQETKNFSSIGEKQRSSMLFHTSHNTSATLMEFLIKEGADVNWRSETGRTCLHNAKTVEAIELLLTHGAIIEVSDMDGYTPLHLAAMNGHEAIVSCLLKRGANVDAQTARGMTPLMIAANEGDCGKATCLLESNANRWLRDDTGRLAVDVAVVDGNVAMTKLLLEKETSLEDRMFYIQVARLYRMMHDPNLNSDGESNDGSSGKRDSDELTEAVKRRLFELDSEKLKARKDLMQLRTPASRGFEAVVRYFVDLGADLRTQGSEALIAAIKEDHEGVVRYLLDMGVDVNSNTNDGISALYTAVCYEKCAMAKLLLDRGANVDGVDSQGETLLMSASRSASTAILQALLDNGADVNVVRQGRGYLPYGTALHAAAWYGIRGELGTIELLLSNGADIEGKAYDGPSPLATAVMYGNGDIVRFLLDKGADPSNVNLPPRVIGLRPGVRRGLLRGHAARR